MPWITSPEVFELICCLFESLESKVTDTDQIFRLGSPLPSRKFLKEGFHLLKSLGISTQLIETVPRPKERRLHNGMGGSFFIDLMKKLMSLFITTVLET